MQYVLVYLCFDGANSLASGCLGPALEDGEDSLDPNTDSHTGHLSPLWVKHTHQSIVPGRGGRRVKTHTDTVNTECVQ